jgi:hypothetical protein
MVEVGFTRRNGRIMEAIGKIGYRWHEEAVERYLYMQPLEEPSEGDWMEAVQLVLDDYQFDSIFMIIDIVGFAPVLTKARARS